DTGSQNNFITCNAAQCLKLKPIPCDSNVQGLGGAAAEINGIIHCPIGTNNRSVFDVDMYVMSKICGDQPVAKLQTHGFSHIAELHLADPGFDIPGPIDVLLGADVFADSLLGERIKGDARQPLAINSLFGWLLLGRTPLITSSLLRVTTNSDELASIVQKFWELDLIPNASPLTPQEVACERAYIAEHYRDSSGRYGVHLPFKDNVEPSFVGSRDVAVRRFKAIERRLTREPVLHQQYTEFMEDYLRSGHMSSVAVKDLNLGRYYPTMCDKARQRDQVRVVFDASAQDVNHKSLNSTLLTGPKLESNIAEVLLRFRFMRLSFWLIFVKCIDKSGSLSTIGIIRELYGDRNRIKSYRNID
ncbi:jg7382, partial [Pararge aegeria aegeria]